MLERSAPDRREVGRDGVAATRVIPVEGMHCAACASKVEAAARAVRGVRGVSVSFATRKMRIDLDFSSKYNSKCNNYSSTNSEY